MILKAANACFMDLLKSQKISALIVPKWTDLDDGHVTLSFNAPNRPTASYRVTFIDIVRISDLAPHQLKKLGFTHKNFILEYTGILADWTKPYYYIEITPYKTNNTTTIKSNTVYDIALEYEEALK